MQTFVLIQIVAGLVGTVPHVRFTPQPILLRPSAMAQMDTTLAGIRPGPVGPRFLLAADSTAPQGRPRAVFHSQAYYTRLAIHRYASYATVPLFAAEYFIGRSLYNNPTTSSRSLRSWHGTIADGIGALFAVNTVTGVWNLWDSRHETAGRTRRYLHGGMMIAAGAGFLATAMLAPSRRDFRGFGGAAPDPSSANLHRALAISSVGVALGSYLMMLLWKH